MKPMFDHFLFGGDWNPEQWPEDTWEHDLDMLEDAHINEVTINVFSMGAVAAGRRPLRFQHARQDRRIAGQA